VSVTSGTLNGAEALAIRMRGLLLVDSAATPDPAARGVGDVVTWFGAMQAQDVASGLWSLGARLPGSTCESVGEVLERGEALRTWPMRGTIHLVPARDAHWMLDLMGAKPLAGAARRRAFLGLDEAMAERAVDVLAEALSGGGRLTRAECIDAMREKGIQGTGNAAYHLLWYASQRGVTCIAPHVDGEQTFVLLDDWVPDPVRLDRDEALATITERYVRSHGPAPVADLAGWTGLGVREVRRGVALAGDSVTTVSVDGVQMLASPAVLDAAPTETPAATHRVLPGFDEFLLGYKDRGLMLDHADRDAVVPGGNGVFRPTMVRNGRVVGTWRRGASRTRTVVEARPFARLTRRDRTAFEREFAEYAHFVGRPLDVRWP
jgi:DNA glycosylase AlkZ-like